MAQGQDPTFSFKPKPKQKPKPVAVEKIEKKKQESKGSFFDFLIPSFVRSSNKADPEGPQVRPRPPPRGPPGPPPPRSPPGPPAGGSPNAAPGTPTVPDFSNFPHLKQAPNRPYNTFPQPWELGGKLNPILINVPGGGSGPQFPPPPGAPGNNFPPPQSALKKIGSFSRVDAEPNLVEDEILKPDSKSEPGLKTRPSIVNLPPSPPLLRRPRPPNDVPLQMTSQPSGIPRLPPRRKQKPLRPPLLNLPGIPQTQQRNPHPNYASNSKSKMDLSRYKEKLQDPDFHQNLTKAHVYHASDLDEELKDLDREDQSVPSFTKALLSYLQVYTGWNFNDVLCFGSGIY